MKFTKDSSSIDKFICYAVLSLYGFMLLFVIASIIAPDSFWKTIQTYFIYGTMIHFGRLTVTIKLDKEEYHGFKKQV